MLLGQLDSRAAALAFAAEAERHRERAALHEALRDEAAANGSPLAPLRLAFDCGARIEHALADWAAGGRGRATAVPAAARAARKPR